MTDETDTERLWRWRVILGKDAAALGPLDPTGTAIDDALGFLYDRESADAQTKGGGRGAAQLTVPEWINSIHTLFPRDVAEILQRDALERYNLAEVVTDLETLQRIDPSPELLRSILATKHLMNDEVLAAARAIVRTVVTQLVDMLRPQLRHTLTGRRDPRRRSRHRVAANFNAQATIRANLKHIDPGSGRLIIREPIFDSRTRKHHDAWQVIILVDQSGSMADSVIHAAVCASIFYELPALRTHLVVFSNDVVDLTAHITDPVQTLMSVQLNGGTDIAHALEYAAGLITRPDRTMIVLISDLEEGGNVSRLAHLVQALCGQRTKVLLLGALTADGQARYDQEIAARLSNLGAEVGVMTPHALADWVAGVIG